ncbi:MAG TPA: His/Gly/Thr/Pro-type tRNA ligase C-terminal domain-containing protein, partial [Burkholderiales bacterium]|nr:His/Gly/Thr/Pro-type tRNA ligase C-terminal domain-containing protein [Burkholderiales bacterium]
YLLIVGDKEVDTNTITVRKRDGSDLGQMSEMQLNDLLQAELNQ